MLVRTSCGFGALLTLMLAAGRADAETVKLGDGSVYVGDLVEKVPNDHITIKLATGDIRRFEWTALLAPTPPPPPPTLALASAAPTAPPPPPAHLEITSDTKGALLVKVAQVPVPNLTANGNVFTTYTDRATPVCYAPCAADIDSTALYFVDGAYISTTRRFAVPAGESKLAIRTGSSVVSATGGWTLAFGIMSAIFGSIATPVSFINVSGPWDGWQYVGVTTLIVGGALILIGAPLIVAGLTHASIGDMQVARRKTRWNGSGLSF